MAKLLNESIEAQVRELFEKQLDRPVSIFFFGSKANCDYCEDARQLLEEVVGLSDLLRLNAYDLDENPDIASQYRVDKAPGIVIVGMDGDQVTDYGIRMSGVPSGHEFSTLIHDLILVSGRDSGLSQETRDQLKRIDKPVHLQVFVTPT